MPDGADQRCDGGSRNTGAIPGRWFPRGKSSIAHKGMQFAGKVMAGTVIDMLEKPELIEEAKKELRRRVGAEGYIPPIPEGIRPMAINPKK